MASIIKIKRSDIQGSIPSSLEVGEIAVNLFDRKLYVGNTTGVTAVGGEDFRLTTQGSVGAEGAFLKLLGESSSSTNSIFLEAGQDLEISRQANGSLLFALEDTIDANTTGNAATATKLETARTIALSGDVTATGVSFDGSQNITLNTSATSKMDVANTRALFTSLSANVLSTANANLLFADKMSVANTRALIDNLSANVLSTANANVRFADKMSVANTRSLVNARLGATATVTLSGDVSGTANFSGNSVTITTQLEDDVSTARLSVNNYIDFTPRGHDDVAHVEGRVFYDSDHKALAYYNEESDVTVELGRELLLRVYNNTGSTITNGAAVYLSGSGSGYPTVAPADATDETKIFNVIGLATHDIEDSSYGYVTGFGDVRGLNTSTFSVGDALYVDPTNPGGLTKTAPKYPNFSVLVGYVIVSDASNGEIFVRPQEEVVQNLRVNDELRVGGDLTVAGDLNVLGAENITTVNNLEVQNSFIYLNGGDTIANNQFTGSGLDDAEFVGHYEGTGTTTYYVRIDGVGTGTGGVDTFEWSTDNFSTTEATGVDITGEPQTLADGISVEFQATTGHTSGDIWDGTAAPVNTDSGWVSNRNSGTYTHMGVFWDTGANRFEFFKSYAPEPEGGIDTADASYALGDLRANTFIGNVTGDVTGDVIGNASTASALETPRTIAVTGDVEGSASFDGSQNISITAELTDTGTPTGTFGSASKIPVITVDADGRITNISNTDVSGVTAFDYYGANNTFKITTSSGDDFTATIDELENYATIANVQSLFNAVSSNTLSTANANLLFANKMSVANTRALYNAIVANTLSTNELTAEFNDRMQVANTRALVDARLGATATVTLSGDVAGTASFSGNTVTINTTIQSDSVALGTDTTGDYVRTIQGTSNEISVTGAGSESRDVTIGLPDDVTITAQLNVGENIVAAGNTSVGGALDVTGDARVGGDMTIDGDLTVEGALTYISTSTVQADDSMFKLAANNVADLLDSGIYAAHVSSNTTLQYAGYFRDASDNSRNAEDGVFKFYVSDVEPGTTVDTTDNRFRLAQVDAIIDGGSY